MILEYILSKNFFFKSDTYLNLIIILKNFYIYIVWTNITYYLILKILIIINLYYFYNSKSYIYKIFNMYLFLFFVICLLYYFDINSYFGFLVFIETTSILLVCIIIITFFNFYFIVNLKMNFFFFFFLISYFEYKILNFQDYFYNYLEYILYWNHNDFTGLFIYLYVLNYVSTIIFFFFFITIFFIIFNYFLLFLFNKFTSFIFNIIKTNRIKNLKKKKNSLKKFK